MADPKLSANLEEASPTLRALGRDLSTEAVLDALKMILRDAPLKEVLSTVTRLIEAHSSGMSCSICLLDDGLHLRYSVANLPEAYRAATDGARIGPNVGSCGAAAYLRQPVFVSDIRSHPNWAKFRDIVLQTELRAAWSSPVISHDGKVLGTFCMYYREVRDPGPDDIQLIDYASRIVGIAIERDRSQAALTLAFENLKKSEAELRQIVDAIPQAVNVLDSDGNVLYANRWTLDYTGLSLEEAVTPNFQTRVFHPEDRARLQDERLSALARAVPFENEQRALGKDGKYRWFLIRYNPLLDEHGDILRWYATGTDVEDRKRAEQRIRNENLALREEIDRSSMYEAIVGSSDVLRKVIAQVSKVAPTDSTVLISGETGTGKELIASAIHKRSKRSGKAFIRVNCAAIPLSLIASELFGHEKGAFTGALQRRAGRFESADGGTLFLDEIGDLPMETQIALLRVLQEREFERVGSNHPISVNVRLIAATNRDLPAAVAAGTFRQDLFYRLNVVPIAVPPLRERAEDIPLLVEYFVGRYAKAAGKKIRHIGKQTLEQLTAYDWPGNIRELQNVVERAVILSETDTLFVDQSWLKRESAESRQSREGLLALADREVEMIKAALAECHGRISGPAGAAARLGIPRQTLESKIRRFGISKYGLKRQAACSADRSAAMYS